MSHFVSTGANFDDLNAQLLQRRTDSEENDLDEEESGSGDQQSNDDGLKASDGKNDTVKRRPKSSSSTLNPEDGRSSPSVRRPHMDHHASSSHHNMSRKNSQEDFNATPTPSRTSERGSEAQKSRLSIHRQSESPSSSRTASPRQRQRHSLHKEVAFSDDVEESQASPTSGHEQMNGSNDGDNLAPPHLRHRFANADDHKPHHVLSAAHQARIKHNEQAGNTAPPRKLGTWDGVFMPVSLNILGIILFLRFGFILGQVGLLGALLLLTVSYTIDTFTAMSVSAISTNGQVRGGGAYYLISRALGPEFGGSIGLVFFLGQALNAAMNVLGFVESLTDSFGESREGFLPEGPWWNFSYGSICLLLSALVCLVGSSLFSRATLALAVVLGAAIISIPISSIFVHPFIDEERGAYYTGWSLQTFRDNLTPHFTSGAAGSSTGSLKESWQTVFGVLFPAVTGLLAGASMSGDLRKPSKSIPKGTNWSLAFTYVIYVGSFVIFAGTIARQSFYLDVGIVSDVALSPQMITFGALASTSFSALMGVMACGKVLQAIARDNLLPVLDVFAQGTEVSDTPTYAVLATWIFCQCVLFVDSVNLIAQLVTMTSLLTFGTLSFATLALKAGGAPSFRPSFRYWNIWTAGAGTLSSFGAMFFTDPIAASACITFAIFLFSAIHIFCPPKPWGDVTRNLNYHIVRKYLLRLDERKGRVTHWRPQILLLANNPRTEWNLIIFCNSLKKGALYVLGHVLKGEFQECLGELRKQQSAWLKLVDVSGIKSFVDVIIARDEREGARNLILSCGLGGMRPNIVCLGFPSNLPPVVSEAAKTKKDEDVNKTPSKSSGMKSEGSEITIRAFDQQHLHPPRHQVINVKTLPTDSARRETPILPGTFVGIMEDSLALQKALAVAYGFDSMSLSGPSTKYTRSGQAEGQDLFLDLWPIQIQSPDADQSHAWDTYTMILQLGTILSMTGSWKEHKLRVSVFVEFEEDIEDERKRVRSLLDNLRVPASLRVFSLSSGQISSYESIVRGKEATSTAIENALGEDPWWEALKTLRKDNERRARESQAKKNRAQPVPSSGGASSSSRKQSKKEQRLMGVSLPKEHLDFFKKNMQIGLAHPKSSRNRGASRELEGESESEYEESDSDGDLSDELAELDLDDLEWINSGSPGDGLKRSQTYSNTARRASNGGEAGKELTRRATGVSRGGKRTLDQGRRSSDGFGGRWTKDQSSQSLLGGGPNSDRDLSASYGSLSSTPRPGMFQSKDLSKQPKTIAEGIESNESDQEGTLKASDRGKVQDQLRQMERQKEARLRSSSQSSRSSSVASESSRDDEDEEDGIRDRSRPHQGDQVELPFVSFNSLPNKAQYLILNELIRVNSLSSTSVVLTALPAPEAGTAEDATKSIRYLRQLESLFGGGPPVLGVHAKQLTMTSAL
ncbi:hypothetical protein CBS101457_005683 [Exobasidium rhododendri]|nr:hypothetical protein CBS101457_005683 [Exobasidium rhododendri]